MRNLLKLSFLILTFAMFGMTANAQNVTVNPGAGSYATLADAFTAINAGTHTGAVTVSIVGDTTEPAAGAILNASGAGLASYTSISITPTGTRTVSGAATAGLPMIDFNGADNVTINGLNAAGNSLTIANTTVSATSGTSTIRFQGDATSNLITNATLLGSATMGNGTNGGVVWFGSAAVSLGNDNNTVSNCNIGPAGSNLPSKAIYFSGSSNTDPGTANSGITITNNNIFDFFSATVSSSGIDLNSGSVGTVISNNRFYQSAARTQSTTGLTHRAININNSSGNAFQVTGNTIGFANAGGTGTYSFTFPTTTSASFIPIFLSVGTTTATSVQGNTVAGISISGGASGTSSSAPFRGVYVSGGLTNIGDISGNTFGNLAATGSISFTSSSASASDVIAVFNFGSSNWVVRNNNIGGISGSNSSTGAVNLYAVRYNTVSSASTTVSDNVIGGPIANSIQSTTTATGTVVQGILATTSNSSIQRNTIRNLTAAGGTGTTTSASVAGIVTVSTGVNNTVAQNTITGLSNTNASAATVITGIQYSASTGTNLVERNLLGFFSSATNSATAEVNGIRVAGGTTTYRNNMIILGAEIPNAIPVNGFNEFLGTNAVLHNSILVTGSPAAGTANSFAFNGQQTTNTRSFRNNIFFNARSNAGATGKNYAVRVGGSAPNPTGLTVNNNVYFANGVGGVFGLFNALDVANLAAWQTAVGQDAASNEANPLYTSVNDLHLQLGSPAIDQAASLGVTNDFDGDTRPGSNAFFDIGADERDGIAPVVNDVQASAFVDPGNGGSKLTGATFSPVATFTNNGIAGQTNVPVRYRICTDVTCTTVLYNNTATIPSLGVGASANVTFPSTSIGTAGTYTIKARTELATDTVPANDEITGTLIIQDPLSGTYTLGAGGNFTSLTNAGGLFDSINNLGATGNLTINITSDLTGETGAVALNEIAGGFTVLIKPSGAPRTITGSVNGALIKINGADGVRIDGSTAASLFEKEQTEGFVGGNSSLRQLTIQNTNVGTASWVIAVQSGPNGANNNVLRNLELLGQDPLTTLGIISIGGATPGTAATFANNGNQVVNCSMRRAIQGIYNQGVSAAIPNTGSVISENNLSGTVADRIRRVGIVVLNQDGIQIVENNIGGLESNESADVIGIAVGSQDVNTTSVTGGGVVNANVTRNRISGVTSNASAGYSAAGIVVAGGTTGPNTISNNLISSVISNATSPDFPVGIYVVGAVGSSTRLYYNSISLSGNRGTTTNQMPSYGIAITGADPTVELKNNVVVNTQEPGSGGVDARAFAVATTATTFVNLDSNYNDLFVSSTQPGAFRTGTLAATGGTSYASLALWQTAIADDANSLSVDPSFVNPANDLHITATSPVRNVGTPVAGVTVDHDNQPRPNPFDALVVEVDMGGDEFNIVTAAPASISGRLSTADGRGIRNVTLTLEGGNLAAPISTRSTSFGYYRFEGLQTGQTYILSVKGRRYVFSNSQRVIDLTDSVTDVDFIGEDGGR